MIKQAAENFKAAEMTYISNLCQIQIPRFIKGRYRTANLGKFYNLEAMDNKLPFFQNNILIGRRFSTY